MTDFEKYRIDKKYVQLLNDYYTQRMFFESSRRDYNKAKVDYRTFAKAENQTQIVMTVRCIAHGSGVLTNEKYKKYYNKHCVPLTRMSFSEIQKTNAANCKIMKERMKVHQHCMNKAFVNLKTYIEEFGYGSI